MVISGLHNNSNNSGVTSVQPDADRRKIAAAAVLFIVLIIMWVRVFLKKGPAPAAAEVQRTAAPAERAAPTAADSQEQPQMRFKPLPVVRGRHDVLATNFFRMNNYRRSLGEDVETVVTKGGSDESVKDIRDRLDLQAIISGTRPQVFINGKLLSLGDGFQVALAEGYADCSVKSIADNCVVVGCGSGEIELKFRGVNDFLE